VKRPALALAAGATIAVVAFWMGWARADTADPGSNADPLVSKSYVDQFTQWRVQNVTRGQQLVADAGLEFVVRAGEATAVVSPQGGVSDLTGGVDRKQGEALPTNHLLIVPRGDGRGLIAGSDLVLLVRGTFTLKQAGAQARESGGQAPAPLPLVP